MFQLVELFLFHFQGSCSFLEIVFQDIFSDDLAGATDRERALTVMFLNQSIYNPVAFFSIG